MSSRSSEALRLARELSEVAGVDVEISFDSGQMWNLEWSDGPTFDEMRDLVDRALTDGRFSLMADRKLRLYRGKSDRAWAARAIAARRDGSLAAEIAAGAAYQRPLMQARSFGFPSDLTAEDHAALSYIARLIDETTAPQVADAPEDEPLIQELLEAGKGSKFKMVRILTGELSAPTAGDRPVLRVLPGGATESRR